MSTKRISGRGRGDSDAGCGRGLARRGPSRRRLSVAVVVVAVLALLAVPGAVGAQVAGQGSWVATAALDSCAPDPSCQARAQHRAAWLPTVGKVLVVGGNPPGGDTAQLYNPADETWAPAASPTATVPGPMTVLDDGRVLAEDQLYDPATDSWSQPASIGSLPTSTRTRLADGRVLATGVSAPVDLGLGTGIYFTEAKLYDPGTDSVAATGNMVNPRIDHAAVRLEAGPHAGLQAGNVLVSGGQRERWTYATQRSAELYDPDTGMWTPVAPMLGSRKAHATVALQDGRAMVVGGWWCTGGVLGSPCFEPIPQAEVYNPLAGAWTPAASMPITVGPMTPPTAMLDDGRVLVVGLDPQSGDTAAAIYDPAGNAWTRTSAMVEPGRLPRSSTATLIDATSGCGTLCGGVLVAGGSDANFNRMAAVEVFRP